MKSGVKEMKKEFKKIDINDVEVIHVDPSQLRRCKAEILIAAPPGDLDSPPGIIFSAWLYLPWDA